MRKVFRLVLILIISVFVLFLSLFYGGFLKFNVTMPIMGKVVDKKNNQPISNASVTFIWSEKGGFASSEKTQKTVLLKEDGSFKTSRKIFWGCPGLGSRIFELEIAHPNYKNQVITIATMSFKDHYNWLYRIGMKKELIIYMIPSEDKK